MEEFQALHDEVGLAANGDGWTPALPTVLSAAGIELGPQKPEDDLGSPIHIYNYKLLFQKIVNELSCSGIFSLYCSFTMCYRHRPHWRGICITKRDERIQRNGSRAKWESRASGGAGPKVSRANPEKSLKASARSQGGQNDGYNLQRDLS
jgi:hypothetical protein